MSIKVKKNAVHSAHLNLRNLFRENLDCKTYRKSSCTVCDLKITHKSHLNVHEGNKILCSWCI